MAALRSNQRGLKLEEEEPAAARKKFEIYKQTTLLWFWPRESLWAFGLIIDFMSISDSPSLSDLGRHLFFLPNQQSAN